MASVYRPQIDPGATLGNQPMRTPESFGAGIGSAIALVGQQVMQRETARAEQEKVRARDQEQASALAGWANISGELDMLRNEAEAGAGLGADGHVDAMAKAFDERSAAFLGTLTDPQLRQHWTAQVAQQRTRFVVAADTFERGAGVRRDMTNLRDARGHFVNAASRAPTFAELRQQQAAFDASIDLLSIAPEQKAVFKREAQDAAIAGWLGGRDPGETKALLQSGALDAVLDPETVQRLDADADIELRRREVEAQARAREEAAQAKEFVGELQRRLDGGYDVSDADIQSAAAMYERYPQLGTTLKLEELVVRRGVNRALGTAAPADIGEELNSARSEIAQLEEKKKPVPDVLRQRADALQSLHARRVSETKDLPGEAARQGFGSVTLNVDDPASVAAWQRTLAATAARTGQTPTSLLPDDAAQIVRARAGGTMAERAQVASFLRGWSPAQRRAILRQVAPGDGSLFIASTLTPFKAGVMFEGEALIRKGTVQVPEREAREAMGKLAPPLKFLGAEGQGDVLAAAKRFYAWEVNRNPVDAFDPRVWRMSVSAAVGGTSEGGGVGSFNGRPVVLPPSLKQSEFERRLASMKGPPARTARGAPIPLDQLRRDFTPVLYRPGVYVWQHPDGGFALAPDGKLYTVGVK